MVPISQNRRTEWFSAPQTWFVKEQQVFITTFMHLQVIPSCCIARFYGIWPPHIVMLYTQSSSSTLLEHCIMSLSASGCFFPVLQVMHICIISENMPLPVFC